MNNHLVMFRLTKYFCKYFVRNTHTQTEIKLKSKRLTELYKKLIMKQKKQLKLITSLNNSAKLQVIKIFINNKYLIKKL